MDMSMGLRAEQRQVLSQKLIQSANILQMASAELTEYLNEQSLENPVMELAPAAAETAARRDADELEKYSWICAHDEQDRRIGRASDDDDAREWRFRADERETLHDDLLSQLPPRLASGEQGRRMHFLIDCLDARGYLACSVAEAASALGITEDEVLVSLRELQCLDPAGVGARDLRECLILQLERSGKLTDVLRTFIKEHLGDMAKNRLPRIAREMGITAAEAASCRNIVRTLNPRPAARYEGERAVYVVPDVIVKKCAEGFEIKLNENLCPDIRLNSEYVRMAEATSDANVRKYLVDKIRRTQWIKECIAKRGTTLSNVARAIVERQRDFFSCCDGQMAPLKMSEIAAETGVHESTVSRAVRGKYLQCTRGTFPLTIFFQKAAPNTDPTSQARPTASAVKRALKDLIETENKKKPRSDSALAALLAREGYEISRRTVAKYREEMNIPNTQGRREY